MYRFYDRFALERSLVLLVNCYGAGWVAKFVAADEPCEAASGCVAVVKSASSVNQVYRVTASSQWRTISIKAAPSQASR